MFAPDGAAKETITCFTIEELLRSTTIIEKERERSSAQSQSQLRRRGSFALRLRKAWKLARIEWEISFENQFWLVLNHREPTGRQARNSRGHSDPRHKCSMLWGILNLCIWFSGVGLFGICKASYPLQLALSCTLWPPWWHDSLFGNVAICHCSNFSLWQCRCIQGNSIGTICVLSRFWTRWWHIIVYHMAFLNLNVIPSTLTLDNGEGWHDISLPIKKTGCKVILEFCEEKFGCAPTAFSHWIQPNSAE